MHASSLQRLWLRKRAVGGMWIVACVLRATSRQTRAWITVQGSISRAIGSNGMHSGRCADICSNRMLAHPSLFSLQQFRTTSNEKEEEKELRYMTGWTVQETVERSISFLERVNVQEPESSVTHLLAHALGLSWETGFVELRQLRTCDDAILSKRTLSNKESSLFAEMLQRRVKHEPLQYILGKWDFLDYTFRIRPPLLCPRPETEELVSMVAEDVVAKCKSSLEHDTLRILDVGCGTGAIGISLVALLPETQVVAMDVEPIAVATSNINARAILGDDDANNRYTAILCGARDFRNEGAAPFDFIVSNPPYIPEHDMATLSDDVVKYESVQALCGGVDGMDVIRDIIRQAPGWSRPGGVIWMEVDPTHPTRIREWLDSEASLDVELDSVYQDFCGRDRFVCLFVK